MPRFFVPAAQVHGARVVICGRDAEHLARSLRMRPGETVVLVEEGRREHGVILESVSPEQVGGRIAWSRDVTGEPALEVHVVQAIPARGMDETVEALALAGATAIWPVLTVRGVAGPYPRRVSARLERWRVIAREAAQLAGRARAPIVHQTMPLDAAIGALPAGCLILAFVIDAHAGASSVRPEAGQPTAVVIGPEGGLDDRDRALLRSAGAIEVHLGARVMPSRLAGFLAVSLLLSSAGDLDAAVEPPPSL
jgi:16S rRNA (uracil1498-N3)-methyltransferase